MLSERGNASSPHNWKKSVAIYYLHTDYSLWYAEYVYSSPQIQKRWFLFSSPAKIWWLQLLLVLSPGTLSVSTWQVLEGHAGFAGPNRQRKSEGSVFFTDGKVLLHKLWPYASEKMYWGEICKYLVPWWWFGKRSSFLKDGKFWGVNVRGCRLE